jgi:hypothetical protein
MASGSQKDNLGYPVFFGYTNVHPSGIVSLMPAKDAGIRIRVEKGLRESFVEACRAQGLPASDVLRDFMHGYAERHQNGLQGNLFLKRPEGRGNAGKGISESAAER